MRLTAPGLGALVVAVVLLAGCGEQPPPDPRDPSLVERRAQAIASANRELDGVRASLGGDVVGRASKDVCYEGQQNWKVDDGYAHRCTVRQAVAISFSGDFRRRIRLLDADLRASGWEAGQTLSDLIVEWWDYRVVETPDEPFRITELAEGGPYHRGLDVSLSFAYGGPDPSGRRALERAHEPSVAFRRSHEEASPFDVEAVLARSTDGAYLVVAAVDVHYEER